MLYEPAMTLRLGPGPSEIADAAALLRRGGLVAFPTETVYGLGADATDAQAVARIYAAKGRPAFNPLIAHVADVAAARREGVFDALAERLAAAFWPGPLTLVLPLAHGASVCELARAGLESVGLRCPSHPVAHALLRAADRPIAGPSANLSGHVSPTSAAHVLGDLDGRVDAVIDGGATDVGIESTIVGVSNGRLLLLRPGSITRAALEAAAGAPVEVADGSDAANPASPGRLAAHYAPATPVRLDAKEVRAGEALLAFGPPQMPGAASAKVILDLSPGRDLTEAAAHLYAYLRALDQAGATMIAVAPIPREGLGEAIMDRLHRAAAASTFFE